MTSRKDIENLLSKKPEEILKISQGYDRVIFLKECQKQGIDPKSDEALKLIHGEETANNILANRNKKAEARADEDRIKDMIEQGVNKSTGQIIFRRNFIKWLKILVPASSIILLIFTASYLETDKELIPVVAIQDTVIIRDTILQEIPNTKPVIANKKLTEIDKKLAVIDKRLANIKTDLVKKKQKIKYISKPKPAPEQYLEPQAFNFDRINTEPDFAFWSISIPPHARNLSLAYNVFSELPEDLYECRDLEYLNLSNNWMEEIPIEITSLTKLKWLNLSSNMIGISGRPELCNLSTLSKLENLNLSDNNLQNVPDCLCNLKNLRILNIKGNNIPVSEITRLQRCLPNTQIRTDDYEIK